MCYCRVLDARKTRQWRYAKTKVKNHLKLGTEKRQAINTAMSRKSYWHLSKTLATHTGMTNDWIHKTVGLVSMRDRWDSLCYPTWLAHCRPARWVGREDEVGDGLTYPNCTSIADHSKESATHSNVSSFM